MKSLLRYRKPIALFYLFVFSFSAFYPGVSWALTSGPTQPEMQGFQASSTSDMVDLFTGDFSYSVPLMDVGGYPLQLSYHSGASIDNEASWVGYGWSLTPGVINRQMRGLPDDFKGDAIVKDNYTQPNITKSISANAYLKIKGNNLIKPSIRVGIRYNNQTGIGASISANANLEPGEESSSKLTAGLGISADNQTGSLFDANINFPILYSKKNDAELIKGSLGFGFSRNAGLESLTLGQSFKLDVKQENVNGFNYSSSISFANNTYVPKTQPFIVSSRYSFKVSLGGKLFPLFISPFGITGSYGISQTPIDKITTASPAYGLLYANDGVKNPAALKDFNRENDIPFSKKVPNLSVPVQTPDLFDISSSAAGGQFKVVSSGSGVFADNMQSDGASSISSGIELGFSSGIHFGVNLPPSFSNTVNTNGKWVDKNLFLPIGDFKDNSNVNPQLQPAFFKKVGEGTINNDSYYHLLGDQQVVRVPLDDSWGSKFFGGTATKSYLMNRQYNFISNTSLQRSTVEKRGTIFSYLTAKEAASFGLNKNILSFPINQSVTCQSLSASIISYARFNGSTNNFSQIPTAAKPHHISEITVTEMGGGRQVFGIPVYNLIQENVSFSVPDNTIAQQEGFVQYAPGASDVARSKNDPKVISRAYHYHYNRQVLPAYATSYLLSGILSPDYVDVTMDGITDDDLGTAVKFNYSKLPYNYRWRTPFAPSAPGQTQERIANYNEGLLADKKDAKATFSYGEREVWYNHSIESKTMVAFFILNDNDNAKRKDGYGVSGRDGGVDWSRPLRYLKEIRLFSKAEIAAKGIANAVPIKVAHFEYNYELFSGNQPLPNSVEGGKLTLKKIWFTFGKSEKGKLSPFVFAYQMPDPAPIVNTNYLLREYDRWGNYKPASANPRGLPNTEYPYSVQNKSQADDYAGFWNLNAITTPTGGKLSIKYESDDYAFVQNKQATVMVPISGLGRNGDSTQFANTNEIYVSLPNLDNLSPDELKYQYFNGLEYLYFKCYTELNSSGISEYVPGYAKILNVQIVGGNQAKITVQKINNYNPVSMAGWQLLKSSLPQIAYPGYDNLDSEESDFKKIASALLSAFARLPELIKTFENIAASRNYCDKIHLSKSWVRINSPQFTKRGGGARVASLRISDDWKNMTGNPDAPSGEYGQKYYYTTTQTIPETGKTITISSGVASYEPMLGNEENPFRLPLFYSNKNFMGPSQTSYIERPLGESFFQAPVVGYSKVRVVSVGATASSEGKTGATETEFYTAKDFPVVVDETPMEKIQPAMNIISQLFTFYVTNHVTCSQGYLVINNNMHGKIKSEKVTDKNGQQISATFYEYQLKDKNSRPTQLDNTVPVLDSEGNVVSAVAGVDVDVYHDMRETRTETIGISGEPAIGLDIPLTGGNYFNWGWYLPNYEKRLFRSTVSIKSVYQFGILKKVTKIINGSRNESENMLWDAETGEVLLTKTQNEYDQPIYSFNYPAHWMYPGMQGAYFNQGVYLSGLSVDANGNINKYNNILSPGDELIDLSYGNRCWVIDDGNMEYASGQYKLISSKGILFTNYQFPLMKVLRSGKRNLSNASTGTLVTLQNPIIGNRLQISENLKILDAKAIEYSEDWWQPLPFQPGIKPANFVESFSMEKVNIKGNYYIFAYLKLNKPLTVPAELSFSFKIGGRVNYGNTVLSEGQSEFWQNIGYTDVPGTITDAKIVTNLDNLWQKTSVCQSPVDSLFNPYFTAMLGNWRPKTSYVYDVKRSVAASGGSGDNISKSGYYTSFAPFWNSAGVLWNRNYGANSNLWRWTQQISLMGSKGEEIENKDALGQYHSALFGYLQSLPVAVASNAQQREVFYEGFEDVGFSLGCKSDSDFCFSNNLPLFSFRRNAAGTSISKVAAHTGNASIQLTANLQLTTETLLDRPTSIYARNSSGEYYLTNNFLLKGFLPQPNKKYVFSCWIKNNKKDNSAQIELYVNGALKVKKESIGTTETNDNIFPLVEGWKRIEFEFNTQNYTTLNILLSPASGSSILIDDIRIYPADGQMKSYVYNASNLRLMAELDENNFATFYDYDNEGIPIRVRKETERGIMTLKETRSANKKN
jgi:hypothetical protein